MSQRGATWYKREPRAFLEGIRRLTEREVAVYAVVLDLIYDGGGRTLNDPKHIASYFRDMGSASIRRTIEGLIESGKLISEGEYLSNRRAKNEAKTQQELAETRRNSARLGGISSGISRSNSNKNNDIPKPNASPNVEVDKRREEKTEAKASSKKIGCRLPEDFKPDQEWSLAQGLSVDVLQREFDQFRDYWTAKSGKDATKLDWQATWRTWVRNTKSRQGGIHNRVQQKTQGEALRDMVRERLENGSGSANGRLDFGDGRGKAESSVDDLRLALAANLGRKSG